MTSSNRHWPSMFKSKHTHLWQNDIAPSVLSSSTQSSHRTPSTSVESAGDERAPEPKPRWNPKPEQIRILESIFNSGMVNPPREEIRKIRAQLQEYGPVGDANVFYWFQNRKSRSKHKLRNGATAVGSKKHTATATAAAATAAAPLPSSTSSPPNKTSPIATFSNVSPPSAVVDTTVGPMMTCYSNQTAEGHFPPEPYLPPTPQMHEFWFPDPPMQSYANYSPGFVPDVQLTCHALVPPNSDGEDEVVKVKQLLNYSAPPGSHSLSFAASSSVSQGAAVSGAVGPSQGKNMAFINDVAFEVPFGPINVRDVFGYDAVLVNSSAQAVVTDEWGFSLQPLQNGASYYLVRPLAQAPLCGRLQDNAADAVVHDLPF